MTRTLELKEIEETLRDLVARVKSGAEIVLTEDHKPVARIVGPGLGQSRERIAGLHRNAMSMSDDFDQDLPESFWTGDE